MKQGFTLAEVLITLGIIGVIAALTMPSLIVKYEKKATINKLKVIYSLLAQATESSKIEHDDWEGALNVRQFAEIYYLPHLKAVKTCTTMTDGCWKDGRYYALNGSAHTDVPFSVILSNGMTLGFYKLNNSAYTIHVLVVDVDGPQKGLNRMGRDVFAFYPCIDKREDNNCGGLNSPHGLHIGSYTNGGVPVDSTKFSRNEIINRGCLKTFVGASHDVGAGAGCAALIAKDDWEIKNDYPW